MDTSNANEGSDSQNNAAIGAALLLVIGEPFSEEHKKLILEEVTKGFRCWDNEATGLDINDELAQIANKADLGEEGPNGERIIRNNSANLVVEILVNPQTVTVTQSVKNFLSAPTKHKQLIYSGHAFQGSGAWILQDDTYTFNNFAAAFKDQDVDNALRQQKGSSLYLCTNAGGDWSDGHISKNNFSKILNVTLNPSDKLQNIHGVLQFAAYVGNFVRVRELNELLQSTDVVGNIRFSRPTLYIFPGCQGDSALFGISGFNLLVNGGYSRKACFWDFTRHLDRIDAALMTHLGTDNLYGLGSVLQRKSIENVHPEIGFMYINASEKMKAGQVNGEKAEKEETLGVNLADQGNQLIQYARQIGQQPQACTRSGTSQTVEPINLFHKVGIGSLDMYILNPVTDSKELKEFYQQWGQKVATFGTSQHVPLPNTLSICALLVWRPSDPSDNITRIFFPGNAPQHKVIEGLEKLKTLNILKHPKCTTASLTTKPATKKPLGLSSKPPARAKASPVTTPKAETPKKEVTPVKAAPTRSRPLSAPKAKKEDVNKKTSKAAEKVKEEKTDKTKSSTSSTPSKGSLKSSAASTPKTPTKEPEPEPPVQPASQPVVEAAPVMNGGVESSVDPPAFSSQPLEPTPAKPAEPEPAEMEAPASVPDPELVVAQEPAGQGEVMDKSKLMELGIYDEDQDIESDLNQQLNSAPGGDAQPQFGGMGDSMHEDMIGSADIGSSKAMQGSFHGDLMSGSMHESMFDNNKPFEDQGFVENGCTPVDEVTTPEDDTSEEIQPQALPEPQAYAPASYVQEPDVIPSMPAKEEPQEFVNVESSQPNEPDLLPVKQDSPDEISSSQGFGEQSTAPVEPLVNEPVEALKQEMVPEPETPDEVENTLPVDDVQEKDVTEEAEKDLAPPQGFSDEPEKIFLEAEQPEVITCGPGPGLTPEVPDEPEKPEEDQVEYEDHEPMPSCVDLRPGAGPFEPEGQDSAPQPEKIEIEFEEPDNRSCVDLRPGMGYEAPEEVQLEDHEPMPSCVDLRPGAGPFEPEGQDSAPQPDDEIKVEVLEPDNSSCVDLRPGFGPQDPEDMSLEPTPPNEYQDDIIESAPEAEQQLNSFPEVEQEKRTEVDQAPEPVPADDLTSSQDYQRDQSPEGFLEPEMQALAQSETPEVDDIIERPRTPEPQELDDLDGDAGKVEPEPAKERSLSPVIPEQKDIAVAPINDNIAPKAAFGDESGVGIVTPPQEADMVVPVEQAKVECTPQAGDIGDDLMDRPETPESDRADSPDSQVDAESLQRDSLEREMSKERSPMVESDDQRDSIERDAGQQAKESSPEDDARDSIERSFSDETDDSEETEDDDEEDEDSSSFEQEEASDEKCLIPDSQPSDQQPSSQKVADQKTDSLAILDQQSDNLLTPGSETMLTPESETTDASPGGQVGYHQIDEQRDQDSDDGVDGKGAYPPAPQSTNPFGQDFEQVDGGFQSGPMSNPFDDMVGQPASLNPFVGGGFDQPSAHPVPDAYRDSSPEDDFGSRGGPASFNPLAEWGEPMGLPSPPPPEADKKPSPRSKTAAKPGDKKPNGDAAKKPMSATSRLSKPKASNGIPEKTKSRLPASSTTSTTKSSSTANTSTRLSLGGKTASTTKTRPASAPSADKSAAKSTEAKPKANGIRRPATASGNTRASPAPAKMPPLPAFTPYYVDLTYIPNHGNPDYSDIEFFKRIRARYYVLSALQPNTQILESLLDAKKTWEDKELAVTVIPTYDNETLRLWMTLHKDRLADHKVEIAPSASRCTIQLQDHETSSSAYRLEF